MTAGKAEYKPKRGPLSKLMSEEDKAKAGILEWFTVHDEWFTMNGSWFTMNGSLFMVNGSWFMVKGCVRGAHASLWFRGGRTYGSWLMVNGSR